MRKIATTTELQHELRQLIDYARSHQPSRVRLAKVLRDISVRVAMEHATPEALKSYLRDHPGADKGNHTVKKHDSTGRADGPDSGSISSKEVSSAIEAGTKSLKLNPATHKGLRDLNKAIERGTATKRDRDACIEDLEFDAAKSESKPAVKKINNLISLLRSEGTNKHLQ